MTLGVGNGQGNVAAEPLPNAPAAGAQGEAAAGVGQPNEGDAAKNAPLAEPGAEQHQTWLSRVATFAGAHWLKLATALGIAAVGFFVWKVVRPFDPALAPQPDIATQWSESVARLGIDPLFPPQEDLRRRRSGGDRRLRRARKW